MDEKKLMVVVPTYNEADNLSALVGELLALDLSGLEVLVVDDNSPDGTGQIADGLAQRHARRVHVLHRPGKEGLGMAYRAGDFSHSPHYILDFAELIKEYDVVIGSRYVSGGRLDEQWGWGRYFLSWWANSVYTRLILGLKVKDATAGFKCWRRATLEGIGLERVKRLCLPGRNGLPDRKAGLPLFRDPHLF